MNSAPMTTVFVVAVFAYVLGGCTEKIEVAPCKDTTRAEVSVPRESQFSETQPAELLGLKLSAGGDCNMEHLNGVAFGQDPLGAKKGEPFVVSGWVADVAKQAVSDTTFVWLQKDAKVYYAKADKVKRKDVAKYLGDDIYVDSGYELTASIDALPNGVYSTMVVMVNKNGGTLCFGGRKVSIH